MHWGTGIVAALLVAVCSAGPGTSGPVVRIDTGELRGSRTAEYQQFQGIPYAAPPVGEQRWRAPRPPESWSGVRAATQPGARCAQRPSAQGNLGSTAEDCLFLNVTAPRSATRKPVVVWLHGGGFIEEAGSDYDTRRLAVSGDVVVVTPNYRLGIFGLMVQPGLAGSGGFALEDQQAALRWVQRNIARFGGDPGNVTLAGESAGGKSVCGQLASPSAAGLFHRVMLQSAPCTGTVPAGAMFPGLPAFPQWASIAAREQQGLEVAAELGCPGAGLACLRRLPAETLLTRHDRFGSPAYGNAVLPVDPDAAITAGRVHRVPVVTSITRDEMSYTAVLFYDLTGHPITAPQYGELLGRAFGAAASRVAGRYPLDDYVSPSQAWAAVTTDRVFACPAVQRDAALAARVPVWTYQFSEPGPPVPGLTFPPGAPHASDLPYLFPTFGEPGQRVLTDRMIGYWASFAHTGKPAGQDVWPRVRPGRANAIELTSAPGKPPRIDLAVAHRCDFWATVPD